MPSPETVFQLLVIRDFWLKNNPFSTPDGLSQMRAQEFQQLKTQLQQGDNTALKWVFEQCGRYCIGTLIQKTACDEADAEDLLMEAVLVFRQNMLEGKVQEISSIKAYLFGIVWNKWRDLSRARKRWQRETDGLTRTYYLRAEESDHLVAAEEEAAWANRIESQLALAHAALGALKSNCRQLLKLFYMEKKPLAEIAVTMGLANANSAKVTKHRCYQRWMKAMTAERNPV